MLVKNIPKPAEGIGAKMKVMWVTAARVFIVQAGSLLTDKDRNVIY